LPVWDTIGKVRMTPKGEFNSSNPYEVLDIVLNSTMNKLYIAKQNVPAGSNLNDTTYWIKILDVSDAIITLGDSIATLQEVKTYLGIT
jgi:hypothetical protein